MLHHVCCELHAVLPTVALLQQEGMERKSAVLNQSFTSVTINVSAKNAFMSRGPLSKQVKSQRGNVILRFFNSVV